MGKPTGFLETARRDISYAPVDERVQNFAEFIIPLEDAELKEQAGRCMDCGVPFCHKGCPVHNQIPDWNDLVYSGDWEQAAENLHSTNNFPEITGRICPALCQEACTLNLEDMPVSIRTIEFEITNRAWEEGWITPQPASEKTGKVVAVVGSGPAGMAAAQQLARAGHTVSIYEKNAYPGGLMRYGIPDFKLDKRLVERRVAQMQAEGVIFHCNSHVGVDTAIDEIAADYDAVLLAGGSEKPRDLQVDGRDLAGIHFAMDFLSQQNRRVSGEDIGDTPEITAKDKHVVVIGGGDTGSDCIGTSFRQGALSVTQLEIMPKPPEKEDKLMVWPDWPIKYRQSSSQAEGAESRYEVITTAFGGEDGKVKTLHGASCKNFQPVAGTEFELPADLVLLAMGFTNPVHEGMLEDLGVELDERGNVKAAMDEFQTSAPKVFAAGDMRRGQSLVVWAILEGRRAAHEIDKFLMGTTLLPR